MSVVVWRSAPEIFADALFETLKSLEAPTTDSRWKLQTTVSTPTIGIGFDLNAGGVDVQKAVLAKMGFDITVWPPNTSVVAGTPQAKEQAYIQSLIGLINANNMSQASYDAVMAQRSIETDAAYIVAYPSRRATFTFTDDTEVRAVFDKLWVIASTYMDTFALSGFNLLPTPEVAQSYVYRVTSINSDLIESAPSNEVLIKDAVQPTAVGTAGICVAPGGNSLTVITTPATVTTNGQVQFTFSEPLDVIAAETVGNYTGTNISAAKLATPTTVVLDFSAPITCINTNTVMVGVGIKDVAGNALGGTDAERTLTYLP